LREKHHLEDLGTDDRITSKWIFNKENEMKFAGLIWFTTAAVAGCCQHCNEPSVSTPG
jgi:predicted metal-binding protein